MTPAAAYWLWQVRSMDEAVEWLKRAPFDGGTEVEIRPVFEWSSSAPTSSRRTSASRELLLARARELG